ncbi:MAG: Rieske (2Fe-2S) protein [Prolixibacteraceae bacterium]|jgi:cytochrome b6-f complex iron-sulfur subunit|nr:Rieske (2Fe-2S) protein [Prolixibacteraceae bacterium]
MKRKDFLTRMLSGGSILLVSPVVLSSCGEDDNIPDENGSENGNGNGQNTIDLTDSAYASLGTVGGFAYKNNIIIVRISDSQYVALSKICTHQGCTVAYHPSDNQIQCPCHGSSFTTGGSVINGPAASPLKAYSVTKSGNTLTIV